MSRGSGCLALSYFPLFLSELLLDWYETMSLDFRWYNCDTQTHLGYVNSTLGADIADPSNKEIVVNLGEP